MRLPLLALALSVSLHAVERRSVFPADSKPVGPYSPGILAGDYLYVSGQGARDAAGNLPKTVEGQTRQCLENIKTIVEAAGLKMDRIVYTQAYLTDLKNYAAMHAAYVDYFHNVLPERSTIGVVRMPLDTPVEINAIAIRNKGLPADRFFLSGVFGSDADMALKRLQAALKAAKLDASQLLYLNVYRAPQTPGAPLLAAVRKIVPDAAVSLVDVNGLPLGAGVEITGVAVRDPHQNHVYRQGGEVLCASAGETVYCAAQGSPKVADALSAIDVGLKALGSSLARAVANTVYLDDIDNFKTMNSAYALSFPPPPPTRTTVQPMPPAGKVRVAVAAVR